MQERMIRNDDHANWTIQFFEEETSTTALSIKQVDKHQDDLYTADFDDDQFTAIGDFINFFVNENNELDFDAMKKAAEFIREQY